MRHRPWIVLALIALVAACETPPAEEGADGAAEDTVAVDDATVEDSIRAVNARFEEAVLAGDAAAVGAFYTDDAILLAPGAPRVEGRPNVEAAFGQLMAGMRAFDLQTDRVEVADSGELAWEVGTYTLTVETPDGATIDDTGKYVVVWESVDGTWRLAVDAFNSDLPPGGAAPEGGSGDAAGESAPADTTG